MKFLFNRNPIVHAGSIVQPSTDEVKTTFGLWNSSYDDAIKFGGDLTREALRAMNLRHDRKHIIVDTKIHMLMPGFSPAIPGWHTDGAPRDRYKNPQGKDVPCLEDQENELRPNRYHILVTGTGCLTRFVSRPLELDLKDRNYDLYADMSNQVQSLVKDNKIHSVETPSCKVVEFDWWDIHTGVIATKHEWRYLIRVCESDFYEPQQDLRKVIRLQSQVYSPANFGW
jgi:hypothetical protein